MISLIDELVLENIILCYKNNMSNGFMKINEALKHRLKEALIGKSYVVHDRDFKGFLVILPYDRNIAFNPWFFNGYPIGSYPEQLLVEGIKFFEQSVYNRVELIGDSKYLNGKSIEMPFAYNYKDMIKLLKVPYEEKYEFFPVSQFELSDLQDIYHQAFSAGDAVFYQIQNQIEREEFWKYLNYDKAVKDPCSLVVVKDNKPIGFILICEEGHLNRHISCMCILPKFQGLGYGKELLKAVLNRAFELGDETITLGTETTMKAYQLYRKFGFIDIKEKSYYIKMHS